MIEALVKIFSANYALTNPAQWAIDFLNGKIRIMPLSYYRDIEDKARKDPEECKSQTFHINIDPVKNIQWFHTSDGWVGFKTSELLKDCPSAVGHSISYTRDINPAILCTSIVPFDLNKAENIINEILSGGLEVTPSKGRYLMVCNGDILCNRLDFEVKINNDFESMVRGKVFYVPSKEDIKSPFCKLQKFSFEHEYRFIFPKIRYPYTIKINPIPGMIFDLEDNCNIIYNSILK